MKKLILLCLLAHCAKITPGYIAPSLLSPINGTTHSKEITFEWDPNNKADDTTRDYIFFLEIAADSCFSQIKDSFSAKVWSKYYMPINKLKSGVYYWRVTATYIQSPGSERHILQSEIRSFIYDGNDGAVFVDPLTVTTGNLGTKTQPVKTIAEAFSVAFQRNLTTINLANASYIETIPQYIGTTVKGCFNASTWVRNIATCSTTISDASALAFYNILN